MDNGDDQLSSSSFLVLVGVAVDGFPEGIYHDCWLIEKTSSFHNHEAWESAYFILEIHPFNTSSSAPKEEGNGYHVGAIFPLFF